MPLWDNRTIEDYKRSDPQGVLGFWMDMMMEICILGLVVGGPIILGLFIRDIVRGFNG